VNGDAPRAAAESGRGDVNYGALLLLDEPLDAGGREVAEDGVAIAGGEQSGLLEREWRRDGVAEEVDARVDDVKSSLADPAGDGAAGHAQAEQLPASHDAELPRREGHHGGVERRNNLHHVAIKRGWCRFCPLGESLLHHVGLGGPWCRFFRG
jgi:hypothetical protein